MYVAHASSSVVGIIPWGGCSLLVRRSFYAAS